MLFNKEADAEAHFARVESEYDALAGKARNVSVRPRVFVDIPVGDGWWTPGGRNASARMIADAGGDFVLDDNVSVSNQFVHHLEVAYDRGLDADVWLLTDAHAGRRDLLLGDRYAASLGLDVTRARRIGLGVAALLAGTVTAFCGPIAFLGILVPHACRLLLSTADHRVLMPAVTIGGAALALGADLVTHLPWSRHLLHVNAVTGAVGGPIVLWMLLRSRVQWT